MNIFYAALAYPVGSLSDRIDRRIILVVGNIVAGYLWDQFGPSGTFWSGAGITTIALTGFGLLQISRRSFRGGD